MRREKGRRKEGGREKGGREKGQRKEGGREKGGREGGKEKGERREEGREKGRRKEGGREGERTEKGGRMCSLTHCVCSSRSSDVYDELECGAILVHPPSTHLCHILPPHTHHTDATGETKVCFEVNFDAT